jgi:hypothetical protein
LRKVGDANPDEVVFPYAVTEESVEEKYAMTETPNPATAVLLLVKKKKDLNVMKDSLEDAAKNFLSLSLTSFATTEFGGLPTTLCLRPSLNLMISTITRAIFFCAVIFLWPAL